MSTTGTTLIQRVRRFTGDWPELDATTASVATTSVTSVTVADTTRYAVNWFIQIDQELMRVTALTNATTLAVSRAAQGTTAATHLSGAAILIRPAFADVQILDAVNAGINATFPYFYKPVIDTSLTADGVSYEYTIPSGLNWLSDVEIKESGSPYYYRIDGWTAKRGATPTLQFAAPPIQGTLRLSGYGPFPQLTAVTDTLDAQWPSWGDDPLIEYATNRLLMSAESRRVQLNAGPQDDGSAPPRQGVTASVAGQLLQRFQMRLQQQAMPPPRRRIVRITF